jgi:hypothetical protein
MALPLGEAGINEIPNESAALNSMQSSIGDTTGLCIFPGLGVGKNPTREQKNEAMKRDAAKDSHKVYSYRTCRFPSRWSYCGAAATKARFGGLKFVFVST